MDSRNDVWLAEADDGLVHISPPLWGRWDFRFECGIDWGGAGPARDHVATCLTCIGLASKWQRAK